MYIYAYVHICIYIYIYICVNCDVIPLMMTAGVVENSGHCIYSIGLKCFLNCLSLFHLVIYIYIYICVCVCMCVISVYICVYVYACNMFVSICMCYNVYMNAYIT